MTDSIIELATGNLRMARLIRKDLLPHGSQREIARRIGVDDAVVSLVMNDKVDELSAKTVEKVRRAIARKLGMSVADAFPESEKAA